MTDLDTRPARVAVNINDDTLRLAATALLEQAGYAVSPQDDGAIRLVSDDPRKSSHRTILFVDETPGAARGVVDSLVSGRLGGAVSRNHPHDLIPALNSLGSGLVTAAASVLAIAADAPTLDKRQTKIVGLVIEGRSNSQIARHFGLSEATIKREISALLKVFHAKTRVELAIKSANVGFAK